MNTPVESAPLHRESVAVVGILVARSDVELLALAGCRGHQALLHPVGIVERIEVRDHARIRARCRGNGVLAQNGGSVEADNRRRSERARLTRLSVLSQYPEPAGPQRRAEPGERGTGRGWWSRRIRGDRHRIRRRRVSSGGRRKGDRRSDGEQTGCRDIRGRLSLSAQIHAWRQTALVTP